jgi:Leucine-rich repeat (LRR) protein
MSPEQAQGERVDARSDLFSLGVLLYRLSTGQLPFQGSTTMAVLMALGTKDPIPVRSLKPELPEGFARLVHDLLSKDPAGRPATATEVIRRLRDLNRNPNSLPVASMPQVSMIDSGPAPTYVPIPIGMASMANPFENIDITESVTAEPKPKPTVEKKPPTRIPPMAIGGALAGLFLLIGVIVIIITNKDGTQTKIEVPEGSKVEVKDKGGKTLAKVGPKKKEPPRLEGKIGLEFQAGDAVIAMKVPYRNELTVTIEAWVTPQQSPNDHPRTIASVPNGYLSVCLDKIRFYTHHGYAQCDKAFTPGQRIHVAGVNDGQQRRLYIDGKLAAKTDDPGSVWAEGSDPGYQGELQIGSMDFTGTIEQVRVSTVGRYDKEFTPPETFTKDKDTFALYLFEEGRGDTLKDSSGNGYHAKIAGAKWVSTDPDRKAAEWVLAKGGGVQVNVVDALLKNVAELPKEMFALMSVNLDGAPIVDTELDQLRSLRSLGWLHLGNTAITDAGIAKLGSLTNLHSLNLGRLKISDAGLATLKPFAKLEVLVLIDTPVTDDGLAHLKGLQNLRQLSVMGTKLSQKALQEFHAAVPGCRIEHNGGVIEAEDVDRRAAEWVYSQGGTVRIRIGGSEINIPTLAELPKERFSIIQVNFTNCKLISDADLKRLKPLSALSYLALIATNVSDQGLIELKEIKTLTWLRLGRTKVTDTGMIHLRELPKLKSLNLNETLVTDVGLDHLKTVTTLHELEVVRTKMTKSALENFQVAVPSCKIEWNGGMIEAVDVDRKAAEWVIEQGGAIRVDEGVYIKTANEIPKKQFTLTTVQLSRKPVKDDELVNLKHLKGLIYLCPGKSVTNAGLVHIKDLKSLLVLDMSDTKITDAGLVQLQELKGLTRLTVKKTLVTAKGLADFHAAVPGCKIEHDGGVIEPKK